MADVRDLLKIERLLNMKFDAIWGELAAEVWAKVHDQIHANDFDGARATANKLNLKVVAERNREWIKHSLLQAGVYGGRVAGKTASPVVASGSYDQMLGNAADLFTAQVEKHVTEDAREQLLQLIAEAEKAYQLTKLGLAQFVQKADEGDDRYVKEFVSFKRKGNEKMQLISSLHTSRLAAWGGLAEAKVRGAKKYRIVEQDDNRTCDFCAKIDGTEFDVDAG